MAIGTCFYLYGQHIAQVVLHFEAVGIALPEIDANSAAGTEGHFGNILL